MNRRSFAGILAMAAVTPAAVEFVVNRVGGSSPTAPNINSPQDGLREVERISVGPTMFNLKGQYGAAIDGRTDDTMPWQNAINDAKASGGEIWVPATPSNISVVAGQLHAADAGNFKIKFVSPATIVRYTGTATPFFNLQSAHQVSLEGGAWQYNNSGFTGILLDFSKGAGSGSNCIRLIAGSAGGEGISTAKLFDISNAVDVEFDRFGFTSGAYAVIGRNVVDDFCNVVNFKKCRVNGGFSNPPFRNAGNAWKFDSCYWEPLGSGVGGAFLQDSSISGGPVSFLACWFGDVSNNAASNWIRGPLNSLSVRDSFIGGSSTGTTPISVSGNGLVVIGNTFNFFKIAIQLVAATLGAEIRGNYFNSGTTAVAFGTGNAGEVEMGGNAYTAVTNRFTGTPVRGSIEDYGGRVLRFGGQPTIAAAAGAGSTGSISQISASDAAGTFVVTPGGTGIAAGNIATVTFATPFPFTPKAVIVVPWGANASALGEMTIGSVSTSAFTVYVPNEPVSGTAYGIQYVVVA
jgi:hypothetical protein